MSKRTNDESNRRTNERTIKRTIKRANEHTNERTNERPKDRTNRRTKKGTNERAHERSNERTKKLTNKRMNKRRRPEEDKQRQLEYHSRAHFQDPASYILGGLAGLPKRLHLIISPDNGLRFCFLGSLSHYLRAENLRICRLRAKDLRAEAI